MLAATAVSSIRERRSSALDGWQILHYHVWPIRAACTVFLSCGAGNHKQPSNTLIKVQVRSNESLDAALRRFKRQCNQAGIFVMMKEKSFFTKPTWARTEAKEERQRVVKRAERIRRNSRF